MKKNRNILIAAALTAVILMTSCQPARQPAAVPSETAENHTESAETSAYGDTTRVPDSSLIANTQDVSQSATETETEPISGETLIETDPVSSGVSEPGTTEPKETEPAENVFLFELSANKKSYSVTGVETIVDPNFVIPSKFNGLSVTGIAEGAFANLRTELESVVIPSSVSSIGENAFWRCYALKEITISSKKCTFGSMTFMDCTSLEEVVIPEGIETLSEDMFRMCSSLKSVSIPSSVSVIESGAFEDCASLKTIIYGGSKSQWDEVVKVEGWDDSSGDYTVKYKVSETSNRTLTGISIKSGPKNPVIFLNFNEKFSYAGLVISANYSDGTSESIKYGDKRLSYDYDPTNWALGYYWEDGTVLPCGPTTVTVKYKTFTAQFDVDFYTPVGGATDEEWVHISNGTGTYYTEGKRINNCPFITNPHYAYDIEKIVVECPNAEKIRNYAFSHRGYDWDSSPTPSYVKAKEVILPDNITSINEKAFKGNTAIEKIVLPKNVRYIFESAFEDCTSLKTVVFPDSLIGIGISAFKNCVSLNELVFPGSLESINDFAFFGCTGLKHIRYNSDVRVNSSCFINCLSLETVEFYAPVSYPPSHNYPGYLRYIIPDSVENFLDDEFSYGILQYTDAVAEYTYNKNGVNELKISYDGTVEEFNSLIENAPKIYWRTRKNLSVTITCSDGVIEECSPFN